MRIGFTGTQRGMTRAQMSEVHTSMASLAYGHFHKEFHHGDCIGADAEAAAIAKELGFWIVSHPPVDQKKQAFFPSDCVLPPAEYLVRNHHIVDAVEFLIATPGEYLEQLRSGTWTTIRYARKKKKDRRIIFPDGYPKIEEL